jgi:hypothetical protein
VEFGGNYKADPVTGSQTVSITKAPLTITAKDAEISYNEEAVNSGVTYEGFAEGEDESVLNGELSYAYNYKQGDNSGEYTITPSGLTSDNYEITFVDGKLTVKALGEPALAVTTEGEDKRLDIVLDQESAEKLLTEDELKDYNNGVPVAVYILVDELKDSEVPAADKKLAENFLKDGKIGQYLDLTLWVQVGDNDPRQITNSASGVTLKIAIPDALKNKDSNVERTFYLIRVHDGKATSLVSTTGNELEADSRLFSTYAIGYKDKTVKDDTKKDTTTKTKTNTSKTDTTKKSSGRSPKTGDVTMLGTWFTLAGASAAGIGALALTGKKRKHSRDDNRTAGRRRKK